MRGLCSVSLERRERAQSELVPLSSRITSCRAGIRDGDDLQGGINGQLALNASKRPSDGTDLVNFVRAEGARLRELKSKVADLVDGTAELDGCLVEERDRRRDCGRSVCRCSNREARISTSLQAYEDRQDKDSRFGTSPVSRPETVGLRTGRSACDPFGSVERTK